MEREHNDGKKDGENEIEDNKANHSLENQMKETEASSSGETEVFFLKLILFDIAIPLFDVIVDIIKGLLLIFNYSSLSSFYMFEAHFNENGIFGLVAISLKWVPAFVTGLHFQDMNRYNNNNESK